MLEKQALSFRIIMIRGARFMGRVRIQVIETEYLLFNFFFYP